MPAQGATLDPLKAPDRAGEEAGLARAAALGDGAAFATLYDRHEERIFNYCERLLGSTSAAAGATLEAFLYALGGAADSEQEAGPAFHLLLYRAARGASYAALGRLGASEPADEVGKGQFEADAEPAVVDPERLAMLSTLHEEVRAANARLPEPGRELLALRDRDELAYDEIAQVMDTSPEALAGFLWLARLKFRDEMRGSALAGAAISSRHCQRALPLLARRQDGQPAGAGDRDWLVEHLDCCPTCPVVRDAMQEAAIAYRAWVPVAPYEWLRQATITAGGELLGFDWSAAAAERTPGKGLADRTSTASVARALWRRPWAIAGLVIVVVAVALGIVVSTGYASPLPTCPSAGVVDRAPSPLHCAAIGQ